MEQERWSRVEELYHSALERPPEHRAAFLAEVCADLELRCEVEALLAQPGDGILDHPVAQAVAGGRLGPYEIRRAIGAGGMGQVFEARDSRLGRSVAIKICSAEFASRFAREAQAISALNHANICTLYDVGPNYLVMELVEGPTLAERIKQGPVPLEEALAIAKQIAEAVEAAHEKGIMHRDLKPGNIKLRPDGAVKVLDFGLAKVTESSDAGPLPEDSPTVTLEAATRVGTILGTAAYMSPEQALGKVADKRTDIWSFGAVLYELLSGRRAFGGESASDILAAVLKVEPDWSALPQETPAAIRTLIRRCLTKDRRQRLQAIGDARIVIEECLSGAPPEMVEPAPVRRNIVPWAVAGVLAIVAIASIAVAWRATRPVDHPLTRLSVDLGPNSLPGLNLTVAISPDGRRLVFPARGPDGKQQLATRLLDQAELTLMSGTEGGGEPFFSPDSEWIGFFSRQPNKEDFGSRRTSVDAEQYNGQPSVRRQLDRRWKHSGSAGEPAAPLADSGGGRRAKGPHKARSRRSHPPLASSFARRRDSLHGLPGCHLVRQRQCRGHVTEDWQGQNRAKRRILRSVSAQRAFGLRA